MLQKARSSSSNINISHSVCYLQCTVEAKCYKSLSKHLQEFKYQVTCTAIAALNQQPAESCWICVLRALQKHCENIRARRAPLCRGGRMSLLSSCWSGGMGWHQHKDRNVMWGISKASFKARPQACLYTHALTFQQHLIYRMWPTDDPSACCLHSLSWHKLEQTASKKGSKLKLHTCCFHIDPQLAYLCGWLITIEWFKEE